jgi:hypothetical protein
MARASSEPTTLSTKTAASKNGRDFDWLCQSEFHDKIPPPPSFPKKRLQLVENKEKESKKERQEAATY